MRALVLLGALFLIGAIASIGAFSWRARVEAMQAAMTDTDNAPSLHSITDIVTFFKQYPPFTCDGTTTSFSHAEGEAIYHHGDNLRIDFTNLSDEKPTHLIITDDGLYAWEDGATQINFVEPQHFTDQFAKNDLVTPALFSAAQCSPWWLPDDSVFAIPALLLHKTSFTS